MERPVSARWHRAPSGDKSFSCNPPTTSTPHSWSGTEGRETRLSPPLQPAHSEAALSHLRERRGGGTVVSPHHPPTSLPLGLRRPNIPHPAPPLSKTSTSCCSPSSSSIRANTLSTYHIHSAPLDLNYGSRRAELKVTVPLGRQTTNTASTGAAAAAAAAGDRFDPDYYACNVKCSPQPRRRVTLQIFFLINCLVHKIYIK